MNTQHKRKKMPIKRSTYQSEETIKEFYNRKDWEGGFKIISKKMLEFVDLVNEHFKETQLIASTSHQRLCIQDKEEKRSNWIIIISNTALDEYHFEYKVPKNKSPWKNAWMKGTADNLEESIIYFIQSMIESEVWNENKELIKLKIKYGV